MSEQTPYEIFRQYAITEWTEEPLYRKVPKPKPLRSFIPIPAVWWREYGHTWEVYAVEVRIRSRVRMNPIRIPFMDNLPISFMNDPPSMMPVSFQTRTYEFQPVGLLQILDIAEYKHGEWKRRLESRFWYEAERLINEKTKVTAN